MMAHLLEALEQGTDIGHYGRLTFAMIARHFMDEEELVSLLAKQPGMDEQEARRLYVQVQGRDYNPPKRERILEWQGQQDFEICPWPDDPQACNVYRELRFPEDIYENVERPKKVRVRTLRPDGSTVEVEGEDLVARIMCHEIDHLHGKLFVDYFGPVKRQILQRRYQKHQMER